MSAPPEALVFATSAPAGTVVTRNEPGTKTAAVFRRPSSSRNVKFVERDRSRFSMRMPVAQRVAWASRAGRDSSPVVTLIDRLLEPEQRQIDRHRVRVLVIQHTHRAVGQRARIGAHLIGVRRIRSVGAEPFRRARDVRQRRVASRCRCRGTPGT